ncbi:MAG: lasso peptide biosynthesis B2 protein [Acidobacteriia bacterium]|nr:lasso peptide biosynthesis B2 protein [Terriglobia bacterium]
MSLLMFRAYCKLLCFDLYVGRGDFAAIRTKVRNCPVSGTREPHDTVEQICAAVDRACIWYWKEVLCLQRSAATACLLRHFGVPAQMMIGTQQMPFKAHAWVEVDGRVVNDRPYMREMYAVLDGC